MIYIRYHKNDQIQDLPFEIGYGHKKNTTYAVVFLHRWLERLSAFECSPQGDLVGIFQIDANRQSTR